jgi:hypothetical protein
MSTIREILESNFNEHEQPFNGLMGNLPDWVPEPVKTRFYDCRRKLQTQYPISQIIEWMNQCDALAEISKSGLNDAISFYYPPPEVEDEAQFLARVRLAVSLEETEGLRLLAGELAVKGRRFSRAGATKKGREFEPKASIRKICTKIASTKFDDVIRALRDADRCADWYESTIAPIGISITGVDDENEMIFYLRRGKLPDKQKTIKFARLRDILTEIK